MRWYHRLALLALAALVVPAAEAGPQDLSSVREMASAGRPQQALAALDRQLGRDPGGPDALLLRGVLLADLGRGAEAEKVFETLIREHPSLPEPYNNLAVLQAEAGRFDRAVETLRRALETHSSYRTAYENLSRVYGQLASEAYSKALEEGAGERRGVELVMLGKLSAGEPAPAAPTPVRVRQPAAPAPAPVADASTGAGATEEAATPAPAPAVAPRGDRLSDRVEAWARAWSEQRVDDYLSFYSPSFRPPDGMSLEDWRALRRERLTRPAWVRVELAFLDAPQMEGSGRANVRFLQSYASDGYSDVVTKTLEMVKEEGEWRILEEKVEE